jgi:hypothetical protein
MNYADEYTWLRFLENLQEAQRRKALRMAESREIKNPLFSSPHLRWFDNQDEGGRDLRAVLETDSQVGEKGVRNG